MNFVGTVLGPEWQNRLAILYLVLMSLWLVLALWFLSRDRLWLEERGPSQTWMLIAVLSINIPLAYLVTTFLALDLVLIAVAYWCVPLINRDYDSIDVWSLAILVCAGAYSFVLSGVLGWIWEAFEIWSLTSFYGEQGRLSRFVYLPLFIFLARWLHLLWTSKREKLLSATIISGVIAGLVVRHWHFLDPWGNS